MPALPSGLAPIVDAYSIGAPGGVTRTPVDGGAARYAVEWDKGKQPFQVTMHLDHVQIAVWTAFFHHVIDDGATAFDMPLDSGFGVEDHEVEIVAGPETSRRGNITTVTFTVLAQSSAYGLTEAEAIDLVEEWNGEALPDGTPPIPRGMRPVTEAYSYGAPDTVFRSALEGGSTRQARFVGRGTQPFRVTLVLTAEQFRVWTAFFLWVIKKGSQPFTMPLDSGFGSTDHQVDIVPDTHSAARNGAITVVSFAVEAESAAYGMTAVAADDLIELYEEYRSGLWALLNRIDIFANQDTTRHLG